MSISVGDKYVIEIGAVAELPDGKKKYFIKPFESLVFDRKGLEQLEKFEKVTGCTYQTGYADGYDSALNDASDLIDYIDNTFIQEYFPVDYNNGLKIYDLNAKYGLAYILEDWKQYLEKIKIKIGDEVSNEDVTRTIIVTNTYANGYFDGIDFNGAVYSDCDPKLWKKTGRHCEIIKLLNQLRGNKDENNN